jgi:hypothetical protein
VLRSAPSVVLTAGGGAAGAGDARDADPEP